MKTIIKNFKEDFVNIVNQYGDKDALIMNTEINPQTLTYRELNELIDRYIALFIEKGLSEGDVVLALLPNSLEMLICFLAAMKGGFSFSPLPCMASGREVKEWINLVNPKISFISIQLSDGVKDEILNSGVPVINIEIDNNFSFLPVKFDKLHLGNDPKIYLKTSGTTGIPKAMLIDGNKLWSSGCAFVDFHGCSDHELCFWNYLPMSYLGGLFNLGLIPLSMGGCVVVDEVFSGKTFLQFWQTIERFNINAIWFVPSIVTGLLSFINRPKSELLKKISSKIKLAFLGTAPIDLATKQKFEDFFQIKLLENFALSETTFFTSETINNIKDRTESSVGEILPYIELKFESYQNDSNSSEKDSQLKEIYVKSPFLFLGYLGEQNEIELPIDEEGFLATGDLGYLDEKTKMLIIKGRKRDIIKKGGYFIALREIEIIAEKYDIIDEAVAVKTSHPFYGEVYNLYVKFKNETGDNMSLFSQYIHDNLVKYKWPEKIIGRNDFPRTASGKIIKGKLLV